MLATASARCHADQPRRASRNGLRARPSNAPRHSCAGRNHVVTCCHRSASPGVRRYAPNRGSAPSYSPCVRNANARAPTTRYDRMTNAQIAAELFLGQKTVESHLRNIFNKLGVADRVAVARAVEVAERGGVRPG